MIQKIQVFFCKNEYFLRYNDLKFLYNTEGSGKVVYRLLLSHCKGWTLSLHLQLTEINGIVPLLASMS